MQNRVLYVCAVLVCYLYIYIYKGKGISVKKIHDGNGHNWEIFNLILIYNMFKELGQSTI